MFSYRSSKKNFLKQVKNARHDSRLVLTFEAPSVFFHFPRLLLHARVDFQRDAADYYYIQPSKFPGETFLLLYIPRYFYWPTEIAQSSLNIANMR